MTQKRLESIWQKACEEKTGNEFIKALRSAIIDGSIPKLILMDLLDKLSDSFTPEGRLICAKGDSMTSDDKKLLTMYGQVLAAQMLLLMETRTFKALRSKMILFLEYSAFVVKSEYDFIGKAVETLAYNFKDLGYDWSTIENATSLDLLAYKICSESLMDRSHPNKFEFTGAGHICLSNGALLVKSSFGEDASTKAFGIDGDKVQVFSRNTRTDRLKISCADDADKLEEFSDAFKATQAETGKASAAGSGHELKPGDKVTLKILRTVMDEDGYPVIKCAALESIDMAEGCIESDEIIKGTFTEDLADYFFEGDCIENAVVVKSGDSPVFSIKEAYHDYAAAKAAEDDKAFLVFEARALEIRKDINRINWITAGGYGAISLGFEGIKKDDIAVLSIQNIQTKGQAIFINVCPPKYGYTDIDRKFDEESVLLDFVVPVEEALKKIKGKEDTMKSGGQVNEIVRSLSWIIAMSTSSKDSLESFKRLLCASFLARLAGDLEGGKKIDAKAAYLARCLEFAQKGSVTRHPSSGYLTDKQNRILEVLTMADRPQKVSGLAAGFSDGDLSSDVNTIISLLIALGISYNHKDDIRTDSDTIRKAICSILGVSDQFRGAESVTFGKYGKGEGQKLEFKSSYVMRNDGKGPDLDYQGRGQVFEAVCAFLNSEGGTVFIGVNDKTGEPVISEEYGLKGDIKWLMANYSAINSIRSRQLGHPVPRPDNLDHFVLFLNAEKELYFKESIRKNITIEATEDQDAIRITVTPSLYEIAFLYKDETREGGQAFMRDGGRTIPMTRRDMEQRLMSLKSIKKEMNFIVTLQEAIDKKHKVILRNYASGNSGKIRDRFVVPVNLFYNDENVFCWDLEECGFKQFRLSRIESIDTDIENPVYTHAFEPKQADVFRWINEESYHIKLRMEVGARNYLLEEYSNAKNLPSDELFEESDGKWILDTRLQGLGAVRRFYLGLSDKIEILPTEDSEALKKDIREYISAHLSEFCPAKQ